jgi:hypothetical protein
MNSMTKEELVATLDRSLLEMAYGDIIRASIQGSAKMAGFILGSCFIDMLAGFYFGITQEDLKKRESGKRYKEFVGKYLTRYDAEVLYKDLRCGLVHDYAEGGSYTFTDNHPELHFKITVQGKIILNLENFLDDLKAAYELYRDDILEVDEIYESALRRLNALGLMGIQVVHILNE